MSSGALRPKDVYARFRSSFLVHIPNGLEVKRLNTQLQIVDHNGAYNRNFMTKLSHQDMCFYKDVLWVLTKINRYSSYETHDQVELNFSFFNILAPKPEDEIQKRMENMLNSYYLAHADITSLQFYCYEHFMHDDLSPMNYAFYSVNPNWDELNDLEDIARSIEGSW